MSACTDGSVTCWINNQVNVLNNIATNVPAIDKMLTGGAFIMGLGFAVKALMCLKEMGEQRTMMSNRSSLKEPFLYFLVASMFLYLPSALATLMNTTFGYSSVLAYAPVDGNSALSGLFGSGSAAGQALARIIQTIGLIAFIRGWILIARAGGQGQQPGGMGKGLIHIFGGVLALNIVGTLQMVNNTLYGTS
jgi:intracellular multiplication protein IcmC